MRLLRRIAGFLGFVKDEGRDQSQEELEENDSHNHNHNHNHNQNQTRFQETGLPRKGFSVPVQVPVDRHQLPPLLLPSSSGDGGVQGLKWYAKRLKIDEDGDVADEFLEEVLPEISSSVDNQHKALPRFQFKCTARPAKIKHQVISNDGKIQQCVEHKGRLQWV